MRRGLLLGLIQAALALSVAGKFVYDRATLPRAWVKAGPVDPIAPIRGRYVRLRIAVQPDRPISGTAADVNLQAVNGKLVGMPASGPGSHLIVRSGRDEGWVLSESLSFFIPEHVPDPSIRAPGEELWVEVSVPRHGLPRPVQLGVLRDGKLTPMGLR